jgi:asparagine synthase (glutamine-hydrolysing)
MMREGGRVDPTVLDWLTKALEHRGPDGSGRYVGDRVGLINTRLAIIDLVTGDQPFESADGVVSVANGEIYNDPQIRSALAGIAFRSRSDCEPPLYVYREKGLDFTGELRGMYAIAIYDRAKDRLVLARDPFGIKQLYFVETPDYFAFASEAQALIAAGLAESRTVPAKSSELLQLKFTTGRGCIFSQIERLLPGETIVVANGKIVERRRQHVLPLGNKRSHAVRDPLHRLDEILADSVAAHVRSDVPYGLFLSGGIDSSTILALMARISTQPVCAFTAAFPNSGAADESHAARRVANAVGAAHHVVELTQADFWTEAPRIAAALDDPTTDAAALPTFKLAAAARQAQIKVVLSGEGADEIFGGYSRYRRAAWLGGLFARRSRNRGVLDEFLYGAVLPHFAGWRDGLQHIEKEFVGTGWSAVQKLQAVDCAEWLPNDLLVKLDRCLMANSIEGRTPFLDPIVGPFGFALPDALKVKGNFGKWLLRKWLSVHLPEAGAFERKKGFNPPVGEWIDAYKEKLLPLLCAQPGIAELSLAAAARKALENPIKNAQAAWSLVFYGLWHSHHVLRVRADGSIGDVLATAAKMG